MFGSDNGFNIVIRDSVKAVLNRAKALIYKLYEVEVSIKGNEIVIDDSDLVQKIIENTKVKDRGWSDYGYVVDHIIETQEQADNAMYDSSAKGYRPSDGKNIAGRKEIGDYEWKNREGSQNKRRKRLY